MQKDFKLQDLSKPEYFEEHQEELNDYFSKGGTWKMLLKIDDDTIAQQYAVACRFLAEENYQEASDLFTYLSILNPYSYDFWMGLASCKQALQRFEEALIHYTTASAINPEHPEPHLYLSSCYFALREVNLAKEELELTRKISGTKAEYAQIRKDADTIANNFPKLR